MWNPEQYARFSDERSRPFQDLIARIPLERAAALADLGCGTGELTAELARRFAAERAYGVDSSPEMLREAAAHAIDGRVSFEQADLAGWQAPEPLDLVVASASLHWVPEHELLLPRLLEMLRAGGVLAFQMPGNFDSPSHLLMRVLCTSEEWAPKLAALASRPIPVQPPAWYLEFLTARGLAAEAWETTYLHLLQGEDPVLEWTAGTALRPVFAKLDAGEQAEFRRQFAAMLHEAYPPQPWGTIFPFRRIFVVARKP